jgi:hypothetical protein
MQEPEGMEGKWYISNLITPSAAPDIRVSSSS